MSVLKAAGETVLPIGRVVRRGRNGPQVVIV
jgi:hypothetical protein